MNKCTCKLCHLRNNHVPEEWHAAVPEYPGWDYDYLINNLRVIKPGHYIFKENIKRWKTRY